jgi:single-stranded-DNA-specific exonuclease
MTIDRVMNRKWLVNRTNPEYIQYLSRAASISPALAQICINRGIKTPEAVNFFLKPDLSNLSDPFDIEGMKVAVERITASMKNNERILVHGDYDVDGVSATALIVQALKALGIECTFFIHHRIEHGYGFHHAAISRAKQFGATLIITVDCGITSFETARLCKQEGIDVIITDHHEPAIAGEKRGSGESEKSKEENSPPHRFSLSPNRSFLLPDALVVINPKISAEQTPLMNLSGAGVVLKLVHALSMVHSSRLSVKEFFDLAALGTIADVVSLTVENRLIVKKGLALMENGTRLGLQALKKVSGIEGRGLTPRLLSFTLIPRMNAAGRVADANAVIDLLLTDSENEAMQLATWLNQLNAERQRIEEEVYQEALDQIEKKEPGQVIVLSSENWHRGVIGIVASRITDNLCRPTFVISVEGDIARGSARSIPSLHLYKALSECREFLTRFGGHELAAGFELPTGNIDDFEACLMQTARETYNEKDGAPLLKIDAEVDFSEIHFGLTKELEMLEPFGFGNPEPLLGTRGLEILFPRIVKNNHLKMKLRQKDHALEAIGFDMADAYSTLLLNNESDALSSTTVDAVFTPIINEWEGSRYLQLNLKAIRLSI